MLRPDAPTLHALWHAAVTNFSRRPALGIGRDASVCFADTDTAANDVADDMRNHGLEAGRPVVVNLTRGPAWLPALLGIWKAGGVAVPAPPHDPAAVDLLVRETGARLHLADGPSAGRWPPTYRFVHHNGPEPPETPFHPRHAYAMLTSGSTGSPKLAMVTHRTSASVLSGLAAAAGIAVGEHALHVASFTFSSSIRQLLLPLLSGAQVTVLEQTHPYAPDRLLHIASTCAITSLDLTPSHLAGLVDLLQTDPHLPKPQALRRLLMASEVLTRRLLDQWRHAVAVPHTFVHLYGQTETGGAVAALPDADLVAVDAPRLPLATPFPPFVAHFEHRPDGTAEMLLAGLDPDDGVLADGVVHRQRYNARLSDITALYRTGDLFELRGNGLMFFQGRADEQAKIRGIRVDLAGLEQHLASIPGVARAVAAVVTLPEGRTRLGVGYTASATAASPDEIRKHAARWLAASGATPYVVRLDQLPLNRSGKVDRPTVVQTLRSALSAPVPDDDLDPIEVVWRRHTNASRAATGSDPASEDFFAAGGDSLSMIALLADVARVYGVRILPEQFHRQPTLHGLRQLLSSRATAAAAPQPVGGGTTPPEAEPAATAFHRGLWINERLGGQPSPYWLPIDVEFATVLDLARLTSAFRATLTRFDALRLAFAEDPHRGLIMRPDAHPAATATLTRPEAIAPPEGITNPAGLVQLAADTGAGRTSLSLRVHHAVADRPSLVTLLRYLCHAYDDAPGDDQPAASFLAWCRQRQTAIAGEEGQAARRFWEHVLPSPATAPAPTRQPRVERRQIAVPTHADGGAPIGATRHAAWLWAYHRALAANDMAVARLIGVDVDLRPPGQTELVGPCVNTLPVVLPEGIADRDGERAAGAAIAQMLPHAGTPITEVVPPSRRPTGDPRQPFFRYHLVHQAAEYPPLRLAGQAARYHRLPSGISEHTVTLFVRESPAGTQLELAWDAQLVDADVAHAILTATATRFAGQREGQR